MAINEGSKDIIPSKLNPPLKMLNKPGDNIISWF